MTATLSGPQGRIVLGSRIVRIGRANDNELVLKDDLTVSGHHAEVRPQGRGYAVVDMGSKNGTFVNGQRLTLHMPRMLSSGDVIRVGDVMLRYDDDFDATAIGSADSHDWSTGFGSAPNENTGAVRATPYEPDYAPPQKRRPPGGYYPPPASDPLPLEAKPPGSSLSKDVATEELQFTAFYPQVVQVGTWHTLLFYAHVESALRQVRAHAAKFRVEMGLLRGETGAQASSPILRGTEITVVPTCQGVAFSPERVAFKWLADWHPIEFHFQADGSAVGAAMNGEITVFVGTLIVATLKMALLFEQPGRLYQSMRDDAEVSARIYQKIFASYSHADTAVVLACRNAYKALGLDVLIDMDTLRSGQQWSPVLMRMIEEADIFQLFWSPRSAQSHYVRKEWEYAIQHYKGEGFIRPVYWKEPFVNPPQELAMLHFAHVQLPRLALADYGRLFFMRLFNLFRRYE